MCPLYLRIAPCYSNSVVFTMHSRRSAHGLPKEWVMRGVSLLSRKKSHLTNNTQTKSKRTRVAVWMQTLLSKRSLQGVLHEIGLFAQILRWISFVSGCDARWCWLKKQGGERECLTKKVISLVTGVKSPLSAFLILLPSCVCPLLFCVVEVDSIPPQL